MKPYIYLFATIVLSVLLFGCTKKTLEDTIVENPVQSGDEIIFGSSIFSSDVDTKTEYGPRTETGVPVYWDQEGDEVAIFCLQTSQPSNHLVNYVVKPQVDNRTHSASVAKVNPEAAGLQWGEGEGEKGEHRFYAFYPASAVKGTEEENKTGMITANIPVNQQPESWTEGKMTINGEQVSVKFGLPNMDYAYMYAHNAVNREEISVGDPISLKFKNLVTVLDITVQGPESGSITVTNINVRAVSGRNVILTGDFTCNIRGAQDNSENVTAECSAIGDLDAVRNTISIPCYDGEKGEFIQLKTGEYLNVKAYLIPDTDENHIIGPRQLQIAVSTLNGAAKRKLLTTAKVIPHKVNRVLLPHLEAGGSNYWMSSLDENIYLSELSIPGSYNSRNIGTNNNNYQTDDISTQFDAGVRAFMVGTYGVKVGWFNPDYYLTLDDKTTPFTDFLSTLKAKLDGLPKGSNEFIFLQISSSAGPDETWSQAVIGELKPIQNAGSSNQYGVYTAEITPDTRIADVKGKIILKFNTNKNDDGVEYNNYYFTVDNAYPALFTLWEGSEPSTTPMRWGTPNTRKDTDLTWFFQEVDNVTSREQKVKYITQLFEESILMYENGDAHDTWFYNCISGKENDNAVSWTQYISPVMTEYLQKRDANASLGLVYMNHVNSDDTQNILQTIIDNNFKFALRKSGTSAASAVSTRTSSDGWDE